MFPFPLSESVSEGSLIRADQMPKVKFHVYHSILLPDMNQ